MAALGRLVSFRSQTRTAEGGHPTVRKEIIMGYMIMLGAVWLAAMLGLKVGELAGKLTDSTLVASLTSCLLYSGLLFAGCWLIMPPPMPQGVDPNTAELNARVYTQTVRGIIYLGVFLFLTGGSICALVPIFQRRRSRHPLE